MKVAKKIVGIDAGYVNFAVCGLSTDNPTKPYYWNNSALFSGDFSEEKLCAAIYKWINKPEIVKLLTEADEIILERQMTMKFQAVNHCVRFRFFEKTREVNPMTVGAFFKLPVKKRREKKKAAVTLVQNHAVLPVQKGKKDDLADAYLLAFYGAIPHFPSLLNDWPEISPPEKKRKIVLDLV